MADQSINYPEMLQFLKQQQNPFSNAVVKDVWEDIIDVPEINKRVTDQIYAALKYVQEQNGNQELLVLGEPGSGKTHLLARIQRRAEKYHKFLFVYVKPIGDIIKINQQILRELMTSLLKKAEGRTLSPLFQFTTVVIYQHLVKSQQQEMVPEEFQPLLTSLDPKNPIENLWQIIKDLAVATREQLFEIIIHSITAENPQIDATFLRVLFRLSDNDLQSWAQSWLKGVDLPETDLGRLGVTQSLNTEDLAGEVLQSMFSLAQGPILLCIDQLESMYVRFAEEKGIGLLFDNLTNYYNQFQNLAILIACNTTYWSEYIEPSLIKSAIDRIDIKESLKSLSREESVALVSKRLEPLWQQSGIPPPYVTFPFADDYIYHVAKLSGWNPREMLRRLKDKFDKIQTEPILEEVHAPETPPLIAPPAQPAEDITSYLNEILASTATNINKSVLDTLSAPEWEDGITGFLTDLLKECKRAHWPLFGWDVTQVTINVRQTKQQKPLSFLLELQRAASTTSDANDTGNATYLIHISNATNGTSVAAYLRRMKEYLTQHPDWQGLLFRDENLSIEKFPASQKIVQELEDHLVVNYVPRNHSAILFSLKKMLEDATGGDLQVQNRIVSRPEVMAFIYNTLHQEEFFHNLFPGLSDSGEISPPVPTPIGQVLKFADPKIPQLGSPPKKPPLPPTKLPIASGDLDEIIQAIQEILKDTPVVNVAKLSAQLQKDKTILARACRLMEEQQLIHIASIQAEEGFVIYRKPAATIF